MRRALGAAAAALALACAGADGDGIDGYRPAPDVDRLGFVPMQGDDIGVVGDFAMMSDSIFLLDRSGRVVVIDRSGGVPKLVSHFGRRGAGPGELLQPTGVSVGPDGVAVIDGTRLHFYTTAGEPLTTRSISLPCPVLLSGITVTDHGLFVAGGCFRGGYASDTMKAVLVWSADTATWSVLAEAPRYTRDGSVGSIFGARNLLTPGIARLHAFGGGEVNCVWRVDARTLPPTAVPECPAARTLYSADPPPELAAQLRTARVPGMTIRWPETLPAYIERFVTDDGIVLLRPFAADSVVLQLAGEPAHDIAVAPLDGLLGCKAQGCLWLRDEGAPELIVLDRAEVERRLLRAKSP